MIIQHHAVNNPLTVDHQKRGYDLHNWSRPRDLISVKDKKKRVQHKGCHFHFFLLFFSIDLIERCAWLSFRLASHICLTWSKNRNISHATSSAMLYCSIGAILDCSITVLYLNCIYLPLTSNMYRFFYTRMNGCIGGPQTLSDGLQSPCVHVTACEHPLMPQAGYSGLSRA